MSASGIPYFRRSWRAIIVVVVLGLGLTAVATFAGEPLGRYRFILLYFQPFLLGYVCGRIHQLADQRQYHSDPRAPKEGGR
jgi:hypothetical protein